MPLLPADSKVSLLIDRDRKCWNEDLIQDNFLPLDAEVIRQIPLSPNLPRDMLVWHYTKHGAFSVRSAYYLRRNIISANSTASSVGRSCWDKLWQKIWQLNLPNKIKVFAWKACNNILPVKTLLRSRRIFIDVMCSSCGVDRESLMHCLCYCDVAGQVWSLSPLRNLVQWAHNQDFKEWFWQVMLQGNESTLALFVALFWGLWMRRNQVIFCDIHASAEATMAMVCNLVSDFAQAQQRIQGPLMRHRIVRWSAPAEGWFKVNFDGARFQDLQTVGVGVAIRNSMGEVMAAMTEQLPFWVAADCVEAFAAAKAIDLARDLGFSDIILEGDSLNVVKALQEGVELLSDYGHLVSKAVAASRVFWQFNVCHVGRMGNMLAHGLARMARGEDHQLVWMEEVPQALFDVVAADAAL